MSGILLRDQVDLEACYNYDANFVSCSQHGLIYFVQQLGFTDGEKPVISSTPSDISQSTDATVATAVVTWSPPTASDNSGVVTLTSTHDPGNTFYLGATTVTYTAVDAAANQVTDSFMVTITGKHLIRALMETNPFQIDVKELVCFISKLSGAVTTAVVTWLPPTASDNSGVVTLKSSHYPGDTFSLGQLVPLMLRIQQLMLLLIW